MLAQTASGEGWPEASLRLAAELGLLGCSAQQASPADSAALRDARPDQGRAWLRARQVSAVVMVRQDDQGGVLIQVWMRDAAPTPLTLERPTAAQVALAAAELYRAATLTTQATQALVQDPLRAQATPEAPQDRRPERAASFWSLVARGSLGSWGSPPLTGAALWSVLGVGAAWRGLAELELEVAWPLPGAWSGARWRAEAASSPGVRQRAASLAGWWGIGGGLSVGALVSASWWDAARQGDQPRAVARTTLLGGGLRVVLPLTSQLGVALGASAQWGAPAVEVRAQGEPVGRLGQPLWRLSLGLQWRHDVTP